MKFLTNAPKKKRRGRFKKGSAAAKRFMASIRPHKKGGTTVAKRRRKTTTRKRRSTRRRSVAVAINPRVRRRRSAARRPSHRRRYRQNPAGLGGIMRYLSVNNLMSGVIDAGEVLGGKIVVRTLPGLVGLPTTDMLGLSVQALTAILAGGVAHTFVNPNAGKMVLAGGLAAPLETILKGLNIPFISANLGEDVVEIDGISAYPQLNQMGSYPQPVYGEEYDYNYAQ